MSLISTLSFNLALHKIKRLLPTDNINTTRLGNIANTIALLRNKQHLRSESRANELSVRRAFRQHIRNRSSVLRVQIGVDFVEEVERCWVRGLDCENEG